MAEPTPSSAPLKTAECTYPALPEPVDQIAQADGFNVIGTADVFTAGQMRAYAAQAVAAQPSGNEHMALAALRYYRDECSGYEPSLSVFHRMVDEALVAEVQAEPVAKISVYMSSEFGKGEPCEEVSISMIWNAVEKLPLGTHKCYLAPQAQPADALDAADWECLAIGRAINRAALVLPVDGEIRIEVENGAGAVYVNEPKHGDWRYIDSGDAFSSQINEAIDAAMAAAQEGGDAAKEA